MSGLSAAEARYAHRLFYETPRTQGMGGAVVAVADDHQALFANPAGLCQVNDKGYAVVNAHGEMNQDFRRVKNRTDGLSDADTPESRAANNAKLSDVMGQQARLVAGNLAYYLGGRDGHGFAGAFLYQAVTEIGVIRPTSPRLQVRGDIDSVLLGSVARPITGGKRNLFNDIAHGWWGATMKFLSRRSLDREYDARDFAQLSESDLRAEQRKGATADFDAGTFWRLKNDWDTTLGLSVSNLLESEVDPSIGRLRREWAVGATIKPLSGPPERKRKLLLAADLWDIAGTDGTFFSRLRLGAEALVVPWLKVRTGVRGGYPTAGFTAEFREARLDFATYSEELGPRPGDREDRRYSLSFGFEF
ncbi:MAG: hypothetical protein OZSIB_3935 [Candidatus Ozemobacter sibiricus]|jgi:hypothetical protein|uniref:Uncharacterized protein n=1 Tax=Candidatus Ozemobacter sibiricus TaxID=2268124 RepID=A0A367ZR10_9BACT|nr:MAG: hypothetical protein OZSIB_3935 [Candidatus Ozemobacter sibiricus]